jgi:hypothetical protein
MKWYKRFSDFSLSRQAFEISPLAHLVYSVLCDTVARSGENGELLAADIDDPSYLARLCNMQLLSPEVIDLYLESTPEQRESVLNLKVCSVETLQKALKECVRIGLIKRTKLENVELYVIDGFTKDNPIFLNPESVKKRKHRGKFQESGTVPGHGVDGTGQPPSRREEKRREKKIKEKKQKADALSPQKPATSEPNSESSEKEKMAKARPESSYQSLKTALEASYKQKYGEDYPFLHKKDGSALKRLIALYEPNLILRRFEQGLDAEGYLKVTGIADLLSKWPKLVAAESSTSTKPRSIFAASKAAEPVVYDYSQETL